VGGYLYLTYTVLLHQWSIEDTAHVELIRNIARDNNYILPQQTTLRTQQQIADDLQRQLTDQRDRPFTASQADSRQGGSHQP